MADGYIVEKKVECIDHQNAAERHLEDASDKVQAAARSVANKIAYPSRNLETEYRKEKLKEKLD